MAKFAACIREHMSPPNSTNKVVAVYTVDDGDGLHHAGNLVMSQCDAEVFIDLIDGHAGRMIPWQG